MSVLETPHLNLLPLKKSDRDDFYQLNACPLVMKCFPNMLSETESQQLLEKLVNNFNQRGFGVYALREKRSSDFVGILGLNETNLEFLMRPCQEILWRLNAKYWGKGYAFEAANFVIERARQQLLADNIIAFTAVKNKPSQRLMQRLGMQKVQYFNHPKLAAEHPLSKHVLYSISLT